MVLGCESYDFWYCLPDSRLLIVCNPETSSRVTLAVLGKGFQPFVACRFLSPERSDCQSAIYYKVQNYGKKSKDPNFSPILCNRKSMGRFLLQEPVCLMEVTEAGCSWLFFLISKICHSTFASKDAPQSPRSVGK